MHDEYAEPGLPVRVVPTWPEVTLDQRNAIRQALEHPVDPDLAPIELRILRRLDLGRSRSFGFLYEGELVHSDGLCTRVVIRLDEAPWIRKELSGAASCSGARAPNVAPILAPTFDGAPRHPRGAAAILYRVVVGDAQPGSSLMTLGQLAALALDTPSQRPWLLDMIERTFVMLDRHIHGKPILGEHSEQSDFHARRWAPVVAVAVDDFDRERRCLVDPFVEEPSFIETLARVGLPLQKGRDHLVGWHYGGDAVELHLPDQVRDAILAWPTEDLEHVEVRGTKVEYVAQESHSWLLHATGFDPGRRVWRIGDYVFENQLRRHSKNLESWSFFRECELVHGHGDLHDYNVLCVDRELTFVGLATAGEGHPRWADAARLIGSLLLDTMAPALGAVEIARALHLAFESSTPLDVMAVDRVEACAALLREMFEAAIRTFGHEGIDAKKELWIDLHHFCWIAMEWCRADRHFYPQGKVTAMMVLASIAVGHVEPSIPRFLLDRWLLRDDAHGFHVLRALCRAEEPSSEELQSLVSEAVDCAAAWGFLDALWATHSEDSQAWKQDVAALITVLDDLGANYDATHSLSGPWSDRSVMRRIFCAANFDRVFRLVSTNFWGDAWSFGHFAVLAEKYLLDPDQAEQLFERAIACDPNQTLNLTNYADFLQTVRGEPDRALALYERAVELGRTDPNDLCNYAGLLFARGHFDRARQYLGQLRGMPDVPAVTELELNFYTYVHIPEERDLAAETVEHLLGQGVRSLNFDLQMHIDRATRDGHPDLDRVRAFVTRIGRA